MKNKTNIKLILALFIMLLSVLSAGCTIGMGSLEDVLDKNQLTAQITYLSNGGYFNDDTTILSRDIYYKESSKAYEITSSSNNTKVMHEENVYAGWFAVETLNIDGVEHFVCDISVETLSSYTLNGSSVIVENSGKYAVKIDDYFQLLKSNNAPVLSLGEAFDFSGTVLRSGDRLYLAAKWVPDQSVEYVLITEDCQSITVSKDGGATQEVQNGQVIDKISFGASGVVNIPTDYKLPPVDSTDATFVDYYVYEEGASVDDLTRKWGAIQRPDDGSNVKVFVKYVYGKWSVIREGEDVKSIFAAPGNNYYVSRDVDCSSVKINRVSGNFSGKIRGNGHTITGISVSAERQGNGATVALFGTMTATASIKDLTLKDVELTVATRPNVTIKGIYLIAHSVQDDATPELSSFKISGVTVNLTLATETIVENIPHGADGYDVRSWLCGGFTNDEEFLSAYPTVKVENYQLSINGSTVATDSQAS